MGVNCEVRGDGVAVVTWDDGENRFNGDSLSALNRVLDDLEARSGPLSLVLTGEGKFFSNGLDLARFDLHPEEFRPTLNSLELLIGRILVFPAYCVAAINGHAFAGGALFSLAFDARVMRQDRGYWCMNEAEIGLALDDTLFSIVEHRLARAVAVDAALTARRFDAPSALAAGIVEEVATPENVVSRAIEIAQSVVHLDRATMATHKRVIHGAQAARLGLT